MTHALAQSSPGAPLNSAPAIILAGRTIARGRPTLVIAEGGVNHNGRLDRALRLADAAADAGADAFKVQVFRAEELAAAHAPPAGYQRRAGAVSQREMLRSLELSDADLLNLSEHCRRRKLLFLATPFGTGDVQRAAAAGVSAIKIASTDLTNTPLLHAAGRTGLPLIVSTGAATEEEIRAAVAYLERLDVRGRLVLLHCVSSYPTPLESANLRAIASLEAAFGLPCGFSDHTLSEQAGAWAVAAGACVLEKHLTLDRGADGPDHALSLDPAGLREYVSQVRAVEAALGSGRLGMSAIEEEVRRVARRSVVAARDLPAGAVLSAELLALKRPGGGIPPTDLERLIGRTLRVPVPRDAPLSWELLA